jgi:UDP-2-acetamido-3-amino-2,3-dideoxy-glucuronate N-acetyltransferase
MRALEAGKHVFVEKPLAMSGSDARTLASVAVSERLLLMVGHVLLFHPAVLKLKELVETGELGRVFYLYGNRQNLGRSGETRTLSGVSPLTTSRSSSTYSTTGRPR